MKNDILNRGWILGNQKTKKMLFGVTLEWLKLIATYQIGTMNLTHSIWIIILFGTITN